MGMTLCERRVESLFMPCCRQMQRKDLSEKAFQGKCTQEKQKLEECARKSFSSVKDFDKDSIIHYECLQKLVKIIKEKETQDIDIFDFLNKLGMGQKQLCTPKSFYGQKNKACY